MLGTEPRVNNSKLDSFVNYRPRLCLPGPELGELIVLFPRYVSNTNAYGIEVNFIKMLASESRETIRKIILA